MSNPVLRNWRLAAFEGSSQLGVFLGEVTGHPLLNDGWIITSPVRWISDDRRSAQTQSRLYNLGTEFPHILFTRLFRNFCELFGGAMLEQFGELMDHANRLCGPLPPRHQWGRPHERPAAPSSGEWRRSESRG